MDQSRRQLLQGAAGLLAGMVAAKAVEAAAAPAALPAVVPTVTPIPTVPDTVISHVNKNGDQLSWRAPPYGRFNHEFYREQLGTPYSAREPRFVREEYLQYHPELPLEARLIAREDGTIDCELAPGLFISPHLMVAEPGGLLTLIVKQVDAHMFLAAERLQENGSLGVWIDMSHPTDKQRPGRMSAVFTPLRDGTFQLVSTALQRPMASGRLSSEPVRATLPYGRVSWCGLPSNRQACELTCGEAEFSVFQVQLHPEGLFGTGWASWGDSRGATLLVTRDRIVSYREPPFLARSSRSLGYLAANVMSMEMQRLFFDYHSSLSCDGDVDDPIYLRTEQLWSRPRGDRTLQWADASAMQVTLSELLGLSQALTKISPACRVSKEVSYWHHWDAARFVREERPKQTVGYRDPWAVTEQHLTAGELPGGLKQFAVGYLSVPVE